MSMSAEEAEELRQCREMIALMKSSGEQHAGLLSSREEELQHCKLEIQQLKSKGAEQSAVVQQQQQELHNIRLEMSKAQEATKRLVEDSHRLCHKLHEEQETFLVEKDELLTTEAMQLLLVSERAEARHLETLNDFNWPGAPVLPRGFGALEG